MRLIALRIVSMHGTCVVDVAIMHSKLGLSMVDVVMFFLKIGLSVVDGGFGLCLSMEINLITTGLGCMVHILTKLGLCILLSTGDNKIKLGLSIGSCLMDFLLMIGLRACMVLYLSTSGLCAWCSS